MKAAILEAFEQPLKISEQPKPEPEEGEVVVRIKSAGINPVDAKLSRGYLSDMIPHEFPVTLGWDMAGVVEERGFSARRFRVGEEVYSYTRRPKLQHGAFAEYICLPESYLSKKPINISFEEAAAIPLACLTAYQSLFDAGQLKTGETIGILGASGGVGTFAVQLAKSEGAEVIAVASKANHNYLKELGADHCIDYKDQDVVQAVKAIANEGVDFVFDAVGGEVTGEGVKALHQKGRLVSIANRGDNIPDDVQFSFVFVEPNSRQLDHIREMVEAETLRVHLQQKYSLDDINQALEQISTGHTTGKLVVKF